MSAGEKSCVANYSFLVHLIEYFSTVVVIGGPHWLEEVLIETVVMEDDLKNNGRDNEKRESLINQCSKYHLGLSSLYFADCGESRTRKIMR